MFYIKHNNRTYHQSQPIAWVNSDKATPFATRKLAYGELDRRRADDVIRKKELRPHNDYHNATVVEE